MTYRVFFTVAAALCLAACDRPPAVEAVPAERTPVDAAVPVTSPVDESPAPEPVFDQAFIDHMHVHAERVDEMMFALADGDLEAARSPATWLSRHRAEDRIPDDWLPHLEAMRAAARGVETATDLAAARASAERISTHCQDCHAVAGVITAN